MLISIPATLKEYAELERCELIKRVAYSCKKAGHRQFASPLLASLWLADIENLRAYVEEAEGKSRSCFILRMVTFDKWNVFAKCISPLLFINFVG